MSASRYRDKRRGERLTFFDDLADKDFGETADDGQDRRGDGLLQDRVDQLDGPPASQKTVQSGIFCT